jgi:hypothetical protein
MDDLEQAVITNTDYIKQADSFVQTPIKLLVC